MTSAVSKLFSYFLLTFSRIFRISMNKLTMSKYSSIVARIYSSGETLVIIICVSKMMNPEMFNRVDFEFVEIAN